MAMEIGEASSHHDLLLKLETFLTTNPELVAKGQEWLSMKDNTESPYRSDAAVDSNYFGISRFFIGRGLDKKDRIVVPMVIRANPTAPYYTLNAAAARSYDKTKGYSKQIADNSTAWKQVSISLWHTTMKYWFFATGRRFIIVVKVSNRYSSMYCGFFKPSGTDLEYPYPMFCGGNHCNSALSYTYDNANYIRSFFNPKANTTSSADTSAFAFTPSGVLCGFNNQIGSGYLSGVSGADSYVQQGSIFPYQKNMFMVKTLGGNYVLLPIELLNTTSTKQSLGWLDGCFYVSGFENSPENIITVDSKQYICFPAIVQNDYNNWVAIRMD